MASLERSCHYNVHDLNVQVNRIDSNNGAIPQAGCRRDRYRPETVDAGTTRGLAGPHAMLARLPTALEAQLQRDSQLSDIEYYALAALSEQPDTQCG